MCSLIRLTLLFTTVIIICGHNSSVCPGISPGEFLLIVAPIVIFGYTVVAGFIAHRFLKYGGIKRVKNYCKTFVKNLWSPPQSPTSVGVAPSATVRAQVPVTLVEAFVKDDVPSQSSNGNGDINCDTYRWSCALCTFPNPSTLKVCGMCHQPCPEQTTKVEDR